MPTPQPYQPYVGVGYVDDGLNGLVERDVAVQFSAARTPFLPSQPGLTVRDVIAAFFIAYPDRDEPVAGLAQRDVDIKFFVAHSDYPVGRFVGNEQREVEIEFSAVNRPFISALQGSTQKDVDVSFYAAYQVSVGALMGAGARDVDVSFYTVLPNVPAAWRGATSKEVDVTFTAPAGAPTGVVRAVLADLDMAIIQWAPQPGRSVLRKTNDGGVSYKYLCQGVPNTSLIWSATETTLISFIQGSTGIGVISSAGFIDRQWKPGDHYEVATESTPGDPASRSAWVSADAAEPKGDFYLGKPVMQPNPVE